MIRSLALGLALPLIVGAQISASLAPKTTLSPKTIEGFEAYLKKVEPQITGKARFAQLNPNEVRAEPIQGDGAIDISGGIVHDWVAATVVRGATVAQALAVLQNYPAYKAVYSPDIIDSKVLTHNGDHWHVYLKIVKTKVFTVVFNTEYDVDYRDIGSGKWTMISRSTKVAELDGTKELPAGTGGGFLWRLNAYWLMEPRGDGVYLECRSISLTRDVPFGAGLVVRPFIKSLPAEALRATFDNTVRAMTKTVVR